MGAPPKTKHVHFPLKSKDLHLSVVNEVKAKSQSKSLSQIEHLLNSNEMDLISVLEIKLRDIQIIRPHHIL